MHDRLATNQLRARGTTRTYSLAAYVCGKRASNGAGNRLLPQHDQRALHVHDTPCCNACSHGQSRHTCFLTNRPRIVRTGEESVLAKATKTMRMQLTKNTERDNTNRGAATVDVVNEFLLTLIPKRLYEDLAEQELLWRYCRVSRELRQQTPQRSGVLGRDAYRRRCQCNRLPQPNNSEGCAGPLCGQDSRLCLYKRKSQQLKASLIEVYLLGPDIHLLDARGVLQSPREEASTLQTHSRRSQVVARGFPRKPDQR